MILKFQKWFQQLIYNTRIHLQVMDTFLILLHHNNHPLVYRSHHYLHQIVFLQIINHHCHHLHHHMCSITHNSSLLIPTITTTTIHLTNNRKSIGIHQIMHLVIIIDNSNKTLDDQNLADTCFIYTVGVFFLSSIDTICNVYAKLNEQHTIMK